MSIANYVFLRDIGRLLEDNEVTIDNIDKAIKTASHFAIDDLFLKGIKGDKAKIQKRLIKQCGVRN